MTSLGDDLARLAQRADGWRATRGRQRGTAFLAGALSILSMAPFFVWPVLFLTLPTLLWLMATPLLRADDAPAAHAKARQPGDGPPPRQADLGWTARLRAFFPPAIRHATATGWWFGFGYHVFGLFWVGEAFLVEAEVFAWLLPFAVTLLPAGLALFTAAACAFTVWAAPRDDGMRVIGLAVGLGATEWLRGHIFTGLPWNVLGYALTAPHMLQSAAWFGIYGLTVLTVLIFAGAIQLWRMHRHRAVLLGAAPIAVASMATLSVNVDDAIGAHDLSRQYPRVRIVQPSVPQREKWRPENQRAIFDAHLSLSLTNPNGEQDDAKDIALIVWPEAAMPFLPLNEPVAMAEIGRMIPETATLVTGALRADPPVAPGERRRVYNSLLVFGRGAPNATVLATYDKTHLVPFGEYLPFQRALEAVGLQQLSRMRGGFAQGPEPRPLIDIPRLGKIAPLICYEAIFPARVIHSRERPRAIVNVTNDGWFGNTTGPRQHLHMARVRAVEEGVPVIRAANNGISAVISPYGRYTRTHDYSANTTLPLNVRGTLDAYLPPTVAPPFYARWGDGPFFAMLLGLGLLLWSAHRDTHA